MDVGAAAQNQSQSCSTNGGASSGAVGASQTLATGNCSTNVGAIVIACCSASEGASLLSSEIFSELFVQCDLSEDFESVHVLESDVHVSELDETSSEYESTV
jgi:hypothetical protein